MAFITRTKEFAFWHLLDDYAVHCVFYYCPKHKEKHYGEGGVYVEVENRKTGQKVLIKELADGFSFVSCARAFLKFKKALQNVKNYNDLLAIL
jgi:hypothetical protein